MFLEIHFFVYNIVFILYMQKEYFLGDTLLFFEPDIYQDILLYLKYNICECSFQVNSF